jgi:hypothetical protein
VSSGNTQIRVTQIPNTVKVNKTIKNIVLQQQKQQALSMIPSEEQF